MDQSAQAPALLLNSAGTNSQDSYTPPLSLYFHIKKLLFLLLLKDVFFLILIFDPFFHPQSISKFLQPLPIFTTRFGNILYVIFR